MRPLPLSLSDKVVGGINNWQDDTLPGLPSRVTPTNDDWFLLMTGVVTNALAHALPDRAPHPGQRDTLGDRRRRIMSAVTRDARAGRRCLSAPVESRLHIVAADGALRPGAG